MTATTTRLERLAPWIAGLLLALPTLLAYYPPMTDLPFHEAQIAILRNFHDTTRFPPGLYLRNLGEPNQLFHMVGWALSYVVSTRWAVKLLVAAAVVGIPASASHLARHIGSSPIAALVVAPMALGWLFSWGLVANLVGLATLLAVLPALDRLGADPTPRRAAVAAVWTVLLYFAHMAMMFVYAGAAIGLAVLHPWSWRRSPLRLSPVLAGLALSFLQTRLHARFVTLSEKAVPSVWHPVPHKVVQVPYILLPAADRVVTTSMFVLCLFVIVAFFWLRTRERASAAEPLPEVGRFERIRRQALSHRWEIFSVVGFIAYLAFPLTLNSATLIYQRWFPPAFAVLAVAAAPRDLWSRAARVARFGAFVLPLATLLVCWPSFVDADRQFHFLDRLLPQIEPGSAVAILDLGPGDPTRTYSLGTAGGRVLATRGGRISFDFSNSSIAPAALSNEYQWQGPLVRLGFDSWSFRPAHDLKLFRYVLARTQDPNLAYLVTYVLRDDCRLIDSSGEWLLFESEKPVAPLLSQAPKMEHPPPEQLRELATKVLDGARSAPLVPQEPDPNVPSGPRF
jgi:hypothetical protein